MNDKIASKSGVQLSGVKNEALDCCDMPILRKRVETNSKIKQQQQQTLITSKIYVRFKKQNSITKSAYRQINLKLNKITYKSPQKIWTSPKKVR